MTQVSFSRYPLKVITADGTASSTKSHEIKLPKTVWSVTKVLSRVDVSQGFRQERTG